MCNCAEYREDLSQIRASEAFLVHTANRMLAQKAGTKRCNPAWRRRAVGSALLLTAGAGCLAVLINLPPQADPEMDQSLSLIHILDTSALTGESVPLAAAEGDGVLSGAINQNATLEIRVTKRFQESTVSKILELTQNASRCV